MFISSILRVRFIAAAALALIIATAAYGFAAANTVPATKAGAGEAAISGYAATNVEYTMNAADPTKIESVEFDLDAAATTAYVQFLDGNTSTANPITNGLYATCTPATNHWTCSETTPANQANVSEALGLRVIAHQ